MAKKTAKKETEIIELQEICITQFEVTIAGTSDLILNKMDDASKRQLLDKQAGKPKSTEPASDMKNIITSMHWYNGTPAEYTEEALEDALLTNAPCIHAFGLKKSLCNAVVRFAIDKYATGFDACVSIPAKNNLIPITFNEHFVDEKLIQAKLGSPVRSLQNRFTGWTATFTVECCGEHWTPNRIINLINLAGFGIGIGSGRSSNYGRYKVVDKSDDIII